MIDVHSILTGILEKHQDSDKWIGAPFEHIKRLSNTKVGQIGLDFVEQVCEEIGFDCEFPVDEMGKRIKTSAWDIKIENRTFELKTATEDVHGSFQFNHIRHHRTYQALLCVGISPDSVYFDSWTKGEVATGKAGHMVSMDKGSSATWKLTKRKAQLRPMDEFEQNLQNTLSRVDI